MNYGVSSDIKNETFYLIIKKGHFQIFVWNYIVIFFKAFQNYKGFKKIWVEA